MGFKMRRAAFYVALFYNINLFNYYLLKFRRLDLDIYIENKLYFDLIK